MTDISRRSVLVASSMLAMAGAGGTALAADVAPAVATKRLALSGYDPVSYFTEGRPEKGTAEYQAAFDDATYWFKSAEHRALFVADPDHYAPQFAGFCTVMLSRGVKREADPEAWVIADSKLYVFAAKEGVGLFREQMASIVPKAAEGWAELRQTP
jgi:YHS domain-containing protein